MGMYTTVLHEGREIQIKTGRDSCDHYRVGDTVAWQVFADSPYESVLLDGCYEGSSHERELEDFVLIRRHVVEAVLPRRTVIHGHEVQMTEALWGEVFGITEEPAASWEWKARCRVEYNRARDALQGSLRAFLVANENLSLDRPPERAEGFSALGEVIGDMIWDRLQDVGMSKLMSMTPAELHQRHAAREVKYLQAVLGPMEKALHVLERALARAQREAM